MRKALKYPKFRFQAGKRAISFGEAASSSFSLCFETEKKETRVESMRDEVVYLKWIEKKSEIRNRTRDFPTDDRLPLPIELGLYDTFSMGKGHSYWFLSIK